MYICYFLFSVTNPMLFFPHNFAVPMRVVGGALVHEFLISYSHTAWVVFSGSWLGSAFSMAVLVIHCVWISPFHHLIIGWFPILYIMLAYALKRLCNLYMQWQKYCFIVCMRVLFVWISNLINWWFYIWLFLWCVFSVNSAISCDAYSLKSL